MDWVTEGCGAFCSIFALAFLVQLAAVWGVKRLRRKGRQRD